jgi:hypothetical protein
VSEPDVPPQSEGQEEAPGTPAVPVPEVPEVREPVQVRLRRAPRYRAFVGTGALLGALVGVLARLLLGDPGSVFSSGTTTGYLAAIGLLLGALLGGAVAVLADRPSR